MTRCPTAVVTGGSSGIGRATVTALAERGYAIGFTYRSREEAAHRLLQELRAAGARAEANHLDLGDSDAAGRVMRSLAHTLGGVDVLVNNAAVNRRRSFLEESDEGWEQTLTINLTGAFRCGQAAARDMVARGVRGRIINISSVVAQTPLTGGAAYCASKAGLELLTQVMALELAEKEIAVNAVLPGHTVTPMNYDEQGIDAAATRWEEIPLGRSAAPSEVASVIAFLASDDAAYITGATYAVDGGLLLKGGPEALQAATGFPPDSEHLASGAERSAPDS